MSAGDLKLEPAPGVLNGQQRRGFELPCGAWWGFSSLRASNTKQRSWRSGASFGKHLPTTKSCCFPPAEPLNLSEFPSSRGHDVASALARRDMPMCRVCSVVVILLYLRVRQDISLYPDEYKFCLVARRKD